MDTLNLLMFGSKCKNRRRKLKTFLKRRHSTRDDTGLTAPVPSTILRLVQLLLITKRQKS
jgi:hypothetical protein